MKGEMSKFFCFAILAALVAAMACSSPTPTPAPTATPIPTAVPTATPPPTSTPQPTATPRPTATPVPTLTPQPATPVLSGKDPEKAGDSGGIAPLSMEDPDALMSQLLAGELTCLTERVEFSRLIELQQDSSSATPEETEKIIDCLGDETVLRAFLTELIGLTGPLSGDTSACLRAVFGEFDVRSVMLARQVDPEQGAFLVGSASAFILTLSCLNEEEWGLYIPHMIMNPDDRGKLQCVVETLGGPEELAATLQSGEGGVSEGFHRAATECELQIGFLPGG